MKSKFKLVILLLVATMFAWGKDMKPGETSKKFETYEKSWLAVEAAYSKSLPKTALEEVNLIYKNAKKDNNAAQIIKALIHKIKYLQEVEEDSAYKIFNELEKEIKEAAFPAKPVLQAISGNMLWLYYQQNRHIFLNRTQTVNFKQDDIKTWDLRKIVEKIVSYHQDSLKESEKLKTVKIDIIDEVLNKGSSEGRALRPTLFDFLSHRAVDFYSYSEAGLTRPADEFLINRREYFSSDKEFADLKIETQDPLSFPYHAIKQLQELTRFHLNDKDPAALIDITLKRLTFVYNKSVQEEKKALYESALKNLRTKYKNHSSSTEAAYLLAAYYFNQGNQYHPKTAPQYKDFKKTAYDICQEASKEFPNSLGAHQCMSLITQITAKSLEVQVEKVNIINKSIKALLKFQNNTQYFFKVYKTNFREIREKNLYSSHLINAYLPLKPEKEWNITVPETKDYQPQWTEIEIPGLANGEYLIVASTGPKFNYSEEGIAHCLFTATNISYIQRSYTPQGTEFFILDRETGYAIPSAELQLWRQEYDQKIQKYVYIKGKKYISDSKGYVNIPLGTETQYSFFLEIIHGNDHFFPEEYFYNSAPYQNYENPIKTFFFTDRSIYRPGQTVYFKGIMVQTEANKREKNEIMPNYPVYATFYDVNHQQIAQLQLRTNEFGTFSGSFQIPTGRLNGNMYISSGYGTVYFSVEEYKRPKFSVEILKTDESYKVNDKVKVKGAAKAFAGYNIDNAQVKYRVTRTAYFPYWWYYWGYFPSSPQMEITNGKAVTNEAGEFSLEFKAIPDASLSKSSFPAFRYEVSVDVTDTNGETRSAKKTFYIGYTALQLSASIGEELDRDLPDSIVNINSTMLSGDFIPAKGKLSVYLLEKPEKAYKTRYWNVPTYQIYDKNQFAEKFPKDPYGDDNNFYLWKREKTVFEANFDTAVKKEIALDGLATWEPGKYLLEMISQDRYGQEIKEIKYFTVYSKQSKTLPYPSLYWGKTVKYSFEPGENAEILIGTSEKDVKVIYELELKNKLFKRETLDLSEEQKLISFPVTEEYRGNILAHVTFIKNNRIIQEHYTIHVPWSNKNLDIKFETFRNKLAPGEKEEWKIKISGKDKDAVAAEMAATLYDASLDTFRPHGWWLSVFPYFYSSLYWNAASQFTYVNTQLEGKLTDSYYYYSQRYYDSMNLFGFYWRYYYSRSERHYSGGKMKSRASKNGHSDDFDESDKIMEKEESVRPSVSLKKDAPSEMKKQEISADSPKEVLKQEPPKKEELSEVKARTNFNETAFFYPQLKTNEQGEIIIAFTIPESLTQWKMMGIAHTKELASGVIYNTLVTQKDLMVVPNLPRFFREGDKIKLSSKVVNLSENQLDGEAELVLLDSATLKPINELFKNQNLRQNFSSKKGGSSLLTWEIEIPSSIDTVTVRIVAKSGKFSDGEEQPVPILKNSMLVTESMPLPIRGKETKNYVFENLSKAGKSNTLKHHKLTLEFNSNPTWYAVLALPYMLEYPYECMEQTFTRYYANSIASHVVDNSPEIKRVFEIWKSKTGSNALTSNLEKNQELKALLLQETPWVLDTQDETQRRNRIALLFDKNKTTDELARAIKKLEQGQMSDGAWPWFNGMQANPYITAYIVKGFAHLRALKVINPKENASIWNMLSRAVPYLDREIKKEYDYLVQNKYRLKDMHISYNHIYYLYARSYFQDIPVAKENKKAHDYYLGQAKKYWLKFNKYTQGMIAISLHRYQASKTAKAIIKSIKEHALYSEEMGMYWKESYGYYWYQAPIEMQALFIEAFDEIVNDAKSVEEMKIWLLKQKQTTDWKTTIATADACYALLLKGDNWLKDTKMAEITLGSLKIDSKTIPGLEAEIGTGYFKTSWAGSEIKEEMGKIKITNPNKGPAWGGIYWQYFENLDKITPHKTPLQIVKKLFLEQPSATGPILTPIKKDTKLKPGDRIKVRIELRVDRNMEYIHMKDMRASGFEPENVISRYKWQDGLGYYEATKDASTNFFMDYLPKGTYVFEYPLRVSHLGDFSNGITTIQCMYAPEFTSHSEGIRVKVENE